MRVLIADDDRDMAEVLGAYVMECGHQVVSLVTGGGLAVIQAFARFEPDVVLLDNMMPRYNGLTVCHALRSRKPDTKIIFISGSVDASHPFVSGCGATAYQQKPVSQSELRDTLAAVETELALA